MPRVGPIFSLDPGYLAVLGDVIQPSQHNPVLEDIGQALTDSLPRNGTGPMTGNLAMGGFKITGGAAAVNPTDFPIFSQVPTSAWLTSVSALSLAANDLIYASGVNTAAKTTLTAAGRALIDDADAAAQRTTLGLVIGTDVQAFDADTAAIAALSGTGIAVRTAANTWAQRQIVSGDATVTITNPAGVAGDIDIRVPAGGGMTLLGTLSTASGNTPTLGSLVLTSYKTMLCVLQAVSTSATPSALQIGVGGPAFTSVNAAASDVYSGTLLIDLTNGYFSANVFVGASNGSLTSYAGQCSVTTASTSITFSRTNSSYDAGSILIYGVK